jgi:hypothetical protein
MEMQLARWGAPSFIKQGKPALAGKKWNCVLYRSAENKSISYRSNPHLTINYMDSSTAMICEFSNKLGHGRFL